MSWKRLQTEGRIEPHVTSKVELDDLRAAIDRNLRDAAIEELSDDNRFGIAYQAALLTAKMLIACSGYRVKGQGAHQTTFQALPLAIGSSIKETADYFDRCRRKRNDLSYDAQGLVSSKDAMELLRTATAFHQNAEAWIATQHPKLI